VRPCAIIGVYPDNIEIAKKINVSAILKFATDPSE